MTSCARVEGVEVGHDAHGRDGAVQVAVLSFVTVVGSVVDNVRARNESVITKTHNTSHSYDRLTRTLTASKTSTRFVAKSIILGKRFFVFTYGFLEGGNFRFLNSFIF